MTEVSASFACFGGTCAIRVGGPYAGTRAVEAVAVAKSCLLAWHRRFTRFDATSELSQLNADPRAAVPISPLMARLAAAAVHAGARTGGLVDATLVTALARAGYDADLPGSVALPQALAAAPRSSPAPSAGGGWRELEVDHRAGLLRRPPGLKLDSGGLGKGLFADVLADRLSGHASYAIDCAGDLRVGGAAAGERGVRVASPFDGRVLHTFAVRAAGVATSGIGRRSWIDRDGGPAHHLLDPATGRPAFTGVVQATAIAPTALEAEIRAKAAVLAGPDRAPEWIAAGGVLVFDNGKAALIEPKPNLRDRDARAITAPRDAYWTSDNAGSTL